MRRFASMSPRTRHVAGLLALLLALLPACSSGGGGGTGVGGACEENGDCAEGACVAQVCVAADEDPDGDGLFNIAEARLGTAIDDSDSDGDGWDDLREVQDTMAPADSDGDGIIDALESNSADGDGDCVPDQWDAENDTPNAEAQAFLEDTCLRGVCADDELAPLVALTCDDGRFVCDYSAVPEPRIAEELDEAGCFDELDNDCDGETDEGSPDTDGNGTPDCADDDDDGDGVYDDDDCAPLIETCWDDCETDDNGDGTPDCMELCREPFDEFCDDRVDCTVDDCDVETGCSNTPDDTLCDDENPCTEDRCDAEEGCVHEEIDGDCDDGDPCTEGDSCQAGNCVPGDNVCECNVDADCGVREDGDLCNGTLVCDTGQMPHRCVVDADTIVDCDTGEDDACNRTECVPETGECVKSPVNEMGECDDRDDCTTTSFCSEGVCVGGNDICECRTAADCLGHEDGNLCKRYYCNRSDVPHTCEPDPNAPIVTCNHDDDTACAVNQCNPDTGSCEMAAVNDGGACDDGLVCTGDGFCSAGSCASGDPVDCDDELDCTADACDPEQGCVYTPDDSACDDGNPCTDDVCELGVGCAHPADDSASCDDGDDCTVDDACVGGVCTGTPMCQCEVDDDCLDYDDGDLCNGVYVCDTSGEFPVCMIDPTTVVTCPTDDDTFCQQNRCAPDTGLCAMTSVNEDEACDDADPCTDPTFCIEGQCQGIDHCDCRETSDCVDQEDGDLCNGTLTCDTSAVPYTCELDPTTVPEPCPTDGDTECAVSECVPATGACALQPINEDGGCDDGDACTLGDHCEGGVCIPGEFTDDCNDENPCTADTCDSVTGCIHTPLDIACDDGDDCTLDDWCVEGTCVPGGPYPCDDSDPCTVDTCVAGPTCEFVAAAEGAPCDDGNACTVGDACLSGECQPGLEELECDDRVECTQDSCDPASGCLFTPDPTACADTVECTVDACDPTPPTCETPPCAPVSGCSNTASDEACSDGVECTQDVCDPESGCSNEPDDSACDDATDCTVDACDPVDGCRSTPEPAVCDDQLDCTADACVPGTGCVSTPNDGACPDDGNPCTTAACDADLGCIQQSGGCACLALSFAGAGAESVSAADAAPLSGGDQVNRTVEAWIWLESFAEGDGNQIVTKLDGAGGDWGLLAVGDDLMFRFYPPASPTSVDVVAADVLALQTWTHVAVSFNRSGFAVRLIVNGVAAQVTGNIQDIGDTDAAVWVGPNPTLPTPMFHGLIDDVRIWTTARAAATIAAEMSTPLNGDEEGLAAYWTFDDLTEGGESGSADFSANGHDLTFGATAPTTATSPTLDGCE